MQADPPSPSSPRPIGDLPDELRAALAERYAMERVAGRGGMATVYKAQDLKHGRAVAVKVLRPEVASALGGERFLREIQVAAQLQHPHIIPLYDSGEADGFLYYVMPFVEGETLRERLAREKQLPLDDALRMVRDVASALSYAHGQGVIHRDVKPENILLSNGQALVADFGIARAVSAAGGAKITETGLAMGTPAYMSPEQCTAENEVDGRSDLYGLACVLYEMLSGAPPFPGSSPRVVMARHSLDPVPPLRSARPAVPVPVERAIETALAKVPADRFATVAGFVEALTPVPGAETPQREAREARGAVLSFWSELKRRHVYHVAALYLAAAWLIVEVTETTSPYLNVPEQAVTLLIVLAMLGFPLALVFAWAFEITREGVQRTQPVRLEDASATRSSKGRLKQGTTALGAVILTLVGAAVIVPRVLAPGATSPPGIAEAVSPTTIAVFPFSVQGSDDVTYLGEGMVNLLSTDLDGAGDLRTVDPRAILSFLQRAHVAPNAEDARAAARHFGAGLYVLGGIVEAGDRIQVTAALHDLDGTVEGQAQATIDDENQLFELVDDLARQLLAAGAGGPGTRLSKLGALTTRSLPALKEYLRGESALRAGQYDSATIAFQRAVSQDTTFALAYYQLLVSGSFSVSIDRDVAAERALRYRNRLAERDRRLIEAHAAYRRGAASEAERLVRSIVGVHPSDVDAWALLGTVLVAYGTRQGRPTSEARAALESALSLDPDYLRPHYGLSWIAQIEENYIEAQAFVERWLKLAPDADYALARRAALAYARNDHAVQERILAELRRAEDLVVVIAIHDVAKIAGDNLGAIEVADLLSEPSRSQETRAAGHSYTAHLQLAMGRWNAAQAELERAEPLDVSPRWSPVTNRATLAASSFLPVPRDELEELRQRVAQLDHPSLRALVSRPYLAGLLSVRLEDYAAAERYAQELETYAAAPMSGDVSAEWAAMAHDLALSVRAHAAWATGDAETALALLDRAEPEGWWRPVHRTLFGSQAHERYLRAELLRELGRDQEALIWYENLNWIHAEQIYLAPAHFRRGEIYERLGELEIAAHHYERAITLWKDCDPELRPKVQQAEQRLARLTGLPTSA